MREGRLPHKHGAIKPPGAGITQGWMVATQQMFSVRQNFVGSMSEVKGRFALDDSLRKQIGHVSVEGDLSQADDDLQGSEVADLCGEMGCAIPDLLRCGLITRRGASDD